ncbi:zinc finger protein ZFP2 [Bombyx mori]|uniref:Uncharacterized protein n=1 Tax=Bombyx mori TaxID=7091 RepID=A0A8R2QXF1_BOMMO|nr:zinc finger protein 2 homolog isoform X1 [Bombyx mori]
MEFVVCRICLKINVKMHRITKTKLQIIYEKLTNIKIENHVLPLLLCYMCRRKLQNCNELMLKALNSEMFLAELGRSGVQLTEQVIETNSHHESLLSQSKIETVEIQEVYVKKEITEQNINEDLSNDDDLKDSLKYDFNIDDGNNATDSEDDVPLKSIFKKDKEKQVPREMSECQKTNRRRSNKRTEQKIDSEEIKLSREEQMEALLKRSKSLNYINSPFKCNLCFRGFVFEQAYVNHKMKHDQVNGPHQCPVCKMHYRTQRHLRVHSVTAHERLYRCNKCGTISHTMNQARDHEKWHNGHTYECLLCGMKFRKPTSYLTHKRKRHPSKYICNLCGESFIGAHGLLMHKTKAHKSSESNPEDGSPGEGFCAECDIRFTTLEAWKRHMICSINHRYDNSLKCKICNIKYSSADSFTVHMKEHLKSLKRHRGPPGDTGQTKVACDQCGGSFANKSKLQAHINRMHLGIKYNKDIVCEVCGKKFSSNAFLRYHQRIHTGEKPYSCETCSRRFTEKNQLRIHVRTHTGEKPYCCIVCGRSFSQKPALNRHYRTHTGAKPYECRYCSKKFSQSNSMNLHVKTIHLKMGRVASAKKTDVDPIEVLPEKKNICVFE